MCMAEFFFPYLKFNKEKSYISKQEQVPAGWSPLPPTVTQ